MKERTSWVRSIPASTHPSRQPLADIIRLWSKKKKKKKKKKEMMTLLCITSLDAIFAPQFALFIFMMGSVFKDMLSILQP